LQSPASRRSIGSAMPTDRHPDSPEKPPLPHDSLGNEITRLAALGAWTIDLPARRLACADETCRLLDLDRSTPPSIEQLLGFCTPASRPAFATALDSAMRDGAGFDLDVPLVTATGREIVVRALGRVDLQDGRPARVVGAFQDITERQRRDDARRRLDLESLATEQAEMLGTFAGGVAHDFNNLLTGIMGYHELIACEIDANSPIRDYVVQSRAACLRARDLLEQILAFARQTATAPHAPLDLAALIESARQRLRLMLPPAVAIETELSPTVAPAPANAAQIQLALVNLGLHLARPLEASKGTLFLRLRRAGPEDESNPAFASLPRGDYACLTVANTRRLTGGPSERRVFERSFTTGEMRENDGLGLAAVFRIVRAHRGLLCSENAASGSEFRIYLPSAPAASNNPPMPERPALRGSGEMIFVVDDEEAVATFMGFALQAKGYRVTSFDKPAACLDALRANPGGCQLLITDQAMPDFSGVDLVDRLRGFATSLPILIMSGDLLDLPSHFTADSRVALLQKPFTTDDLITAVHRGLANRPASA
jgi:signal transduction histidine kinase/CheY-like chemotaxis protein